MENSDSKIIGFIDIGTNSIHLLVVRFFGDSMGTPIFQDKETVRLGQNLFKNGFIDVATMDKTFLVVSKFVQMSKDMGAEKTIALATCAAREARNSNEIINHLRMTGAEVNIISGQEEARLIRLGVLGPSTPDDKKCLCVDIGGGSTEIILAKGGEDVYLDSLSMGAVRYAYGLSIDQSKPLSFRDYDMLRREVDQSSYRTCRKIRDIGFDIAYGSSGTMIALAEMCATKRGDGDSSYMMYYELVELMKELYRMDIKDRSHVPGMNPSRADIIVAGGAIAEELMYLLEIDRIEISPNGLKQGMEVDYLLKNGHSDFNIRDSAVYNLANRCQYDKDHAEMVRKNALAIFDQIKAIGIHNMSDATRELLAYACILHDIGEFISYSKHHIHSYTIILNSYLPGFVNEELKDMALMARFHHKKFPTVDSKLFSGMSPKDIHDILECALMLKMGDIMDRHRNSSMESISITRTDDTMIFELSSDMDISMEIWKLNSIKDEFRDVFGLELKIVWAHQFK